MKRVPNPRRLDLKAWAEQLDRGASDAPAQAGGELAVAELPRLAAELVAESRNVLLNWQARPELRNRRHVQPDLWLHLEAHATVQMACQRCLQPVAVTLEVDRSFRFVSDEALAALQDEEAEEDVLALDGPLDLQDLLEDELILALPLAPRHEVCPLELPHEVVDPDFDTASTPTPAPFAALAALKVPKN